MQRSYARARGEPGDEAMEKLQLSDLRGETWKKEFKRWNVEKVFTASEAFKSLLDGAEVSQTQIE